jgi:hypothetical protein
VKRCHSCNEFKALTEYSKQAVSPDGLDYKCKVCIAKRWKRYAETHRDELRERAINRYHENPVKNKLASTKAMRTRVYGVDSTLYDRLFEMQKGLCAICSKVDGRGRSLSVDHCHKTGLVRGLLCSKCNLTLGTFEDDSSRFQSAADYLRNMGLP